MSNCKCIEEFDAKLKEYNTELTQHVVMGIEKISLSLVIKTNKIATRKRGKAISVFPSFCPFCGLKYPPLDKKD